MKVVEHHKDVKVKVAAKIIIVHYPYQAFWREASPFDFENATAKDNEPVDEEVDEDIKGKCLSKNSENLMVRTYEDINSKCLSKSSENLMVRLMKTAGIERRKPKKAPRTRPQSTSICRKVEGRK